MTKFPYPVELGTDPTDGTPKMGYVINDMFIHEPTVSECGRFEVDPQEAYGLSPGDVEALARLNQALVKAAERALNEGAREIQDALGVTTGDFAGMHFSDGAQQAAIRAILAQYMAAEIQMAQPSQAQTQRERAGA